MVKRKKREISEEAKFSTEIQRDHSQNSSNIRPKCKLERERDLN